MRRRVFLVFLSVKKIPFSLNFFGHLPRQEARWKGSYMCSGGAGNGGQGRPLHLLQLVGWRTAKTKIRRVVWIRLKANSRTIPRGPGRWKSC